MKLFIHAQIVYNSTNNSAAPSGFKWNPACVTSYASGGQVGVVTVAARADFEGTQS